MAKAMPDVRILFCGFAAGEAVGISEATRKLPNVYFETSLFKIAVGDMPATAAAIGEDHLLFGSSYPFYVMKTQVMNLEEAGLSEQAERKIYAENAETFFAG